jgi:hypothetical protein
LKCHVNTSLLQILFGEISPSARLPFTVYPNNWEAGTEMNNMSMQAGLGRTYRYLTTKPTYRFGMGLSYTSFELSALSILPNLAVRDDVCATREAGATSLARVCGNLSNVGSRGSGVVVLMYIQPTQLSKPFRVMPTMQLYDFLRVDFISIGESTELCSTICDTDVSFVDPSDGARHVLAGSYSVVFDNGQDHGATQSVALNVASKYARIVQTVPKMPGNNIPY